MVGRSQHDAVVDFDFCWACFTPFAVAKKLATILDNNQVDTVITALRTSRSRCRGCSDRAV